MFQYFKKNQKKNYNKSSAVNLFIVFKTFRTDFFLIQESTDQPYGFPPNVAKQIVSKVSLIILTQLPK